jgi:hypothetical protein
MKKRLIFLIIISFTLTAIIGAQVRYTIIPETPIPGDPVTIGVNSAARHALLLVNGRQMARSAFFPVPAENGQPDFMAAILTIPSTVEGGQAIIKVENERGVICEIPVTVADRTFPSETLRLNPALTGLLSDPDPQKTIEANRLWAILSATGNAVYHTGPFIMPVSSNRRTSSFGSRRINEYSDGRRTTSIHAGVDYAAPSGTPVIACGAGRVVLARMRIVTGNSVIIEHAPGIYSIYYHLESISIEEETFVQTGELIGHVGSTGFSTGPHLHWEIRVSTENTDPHAFMVRPILDKSFIISRLYNID